MRLKSFSQNEILEKFVSEKNEKTVTIPDTDSFAGGVLTLTKLTKGEVYPVTGIYHEGYDLGEYQSVMTSIGSIPSNDIKEGNIIPNKPIQSGWSKTLGYLMVFPLGIIVLFLGILVNLLPA